MRWIFLFAVGFFVVGLSAATLPDWARPATTPAALTWKNRETSVTLWNEDSLDYLRADFYRRTVRSVIQLNRPAESQAAPQPIFGYNQDTDRIISLKLWHHTPGGKTRVLSKQYLNDVATYPSQHYWNAYRTLLLYQPPDIKAGDLLVYEITYEGSTNPIQSKGWDAGKRPLYHGRLMVSSAAGTRIHWYGTDLLLQSPDIDPATGVHQWSLDKYVPQHTGNPTAFLAAPMSVFVNCSAPDAPISTWTEISGTVAGLIEPQARSTPAVLVSAQAAIAGKVTRWEKIRALVDMIQADVSYLSMAESRDVLDGYRPQTAEQCLLNRYGDCKDKATLLVSLLRSIGEQGHVLLLYAGNPTLVAPERAIAVFNHAITAITADDDTPSGWPVATHPRLGKFVIVDSTTSSNPLGTLPRMDQSGYGLLVLPEGGDLVALPSDVPGGHHGIRARLTMTLNSRGEGTVHLEERYRGQAAAGLKNGRLKQPRQDLQPALEKRFSTLAPRIENLQWTENADELENLTDLTIDFRTPNYANPAGNSLILINLPSPNYPSPLAPWHTTQAGQSMLPLIDLDTDIVISLPPGLVLAEPVSTLTLRAEDAEATLTGEQQGNELHFRTTFLQKAGPHDRPEYEALRSLGQKYLQAIKRPIVLKSGVPPVTGGNNSPSALSDVALR